MNGYSWTTRTGQGGPGFLTSLAVLVAVTWITDPIVAGGRPESGELTAMMTRPSTVGTVCLFTLKTSLVLTWSAVIVRPRSGSFTMRCMA